MALLNSMYGDDNGGFGTRRIRAGTGRKKALLEGGGPLLFAGAKARKGGARKSTIQCKACGQVGRNLSLITVHLKPYPLDFSPMLGLGLWLCYRITRMCMPCKPCNRL